jgi:uncharacterized protein
MLRVVLDTNVLVSALLKPHSTPELVIPLILEKQVILYLSEAIAVEYDEVLMLPKFRSLDPNKVESFLHRLKAEAWLVSPKIHLDIVETDLGDNKFLECAEEAKADFLITGNTQHFPFKKFQKTRIVSPAEFLAVITKKLPM